MEASDICEKRACVDHFYENIYVSLAMTILCFSALVFGFGHERGEGNKILLWGIMMGIMLFRLFDTFYWQARLQGKAFDPDPPLFRFIIATTGTALVWVAYTLLFFANMSTTELATTLILMSTIAVGASNSLAANQYLAMLYTTLMVLPISLLIAFDSGDDFRIIGYVGVAYWCIAIILVNRSYGSFKRLVGLQAKSDVLAETVEEEQHQNKTLVLALNSAENALEAAKANLHEEVTRQTDQIHRLSNRDPLTGLMNRGGFLRYFTSLLDDPSKPSSRFSVLFIDLDGFKRVNDTLGHQVGDQVLIQVAKRLSRYCEPDHIARWGGDEFVIALPYANNETATAVANACRNGVTVPLEIDDKQISLDATIGIAICPEHGKTAQALVERADLAMYEQKRNQRGAIGLFSETISQRVKHEQTLMEGLHKAIARNELSLMYQPILSSDGHRLVAVEALLRWRFEGQFIPPATFIPLAEKSGLIHDIGSWVLHRACIDASQWQFEETVSVSVNVSVIQLMDDTFTRTLDRVLDSSGLSPSRLHLEITESVFADNQATVIHQVNGIKARDVHISIDDFGTGYSSLSQLNSLSFDTIKIDRSFVQQLEEGSDTIIRATIFIAKEFGCRTIAEGIETKAHCDRLRAMGVDALQGYFYAKPLPISELMHWYLEHKKTPTANAQ